MAAKMKKPVKQDKNDESTKPEKAVKGKGRGVEKEILKITGETPRKKDETFGAYMVRLCTALSDDKIPEEEYEKLSDETKGWFEKATEKVNAIIDDEGKPKGDPEEAPFPGTVVEKPSESPPPEEKKNKGEKNEQLSPPRVSESGSASVRAIVCEKVGEIELEALQEECKKRKVQISSAQMLTVLLETKRTIAMLKQVGVRLTASSK